MPDVTEQLRSYGDAVEAAVPSAEARKPRDRRPFLLAAAALVLVACVGAGVWALRADDGAEDDGPVVDTTDVPPVEAGWQTLDPGPLEPREGAAVVWTGEELVVWGGTRTETGVGFADGAAFDPASGEWRTMSSPPVDRGGLAGGVWTGEEVLVWSAEIDGERDDLADWTVLAWDPATDQWRAAGERCLVGNEVRRCPVAMPDRSWGVGALEPVWTGEEILDIGIGAAYDPASDVWRTLPERPIQGTAGAAAWTGDALVILVANRSDASYPPGESVALAYEPDTDRWEALPPTGVGENGVDLTWDGRHLVALDYEMRAGTFRPGDDAWEALPPLPMRFSECSPQLAPVAGTVFARHCSGQALLTEDREWAIAIPEDESWGTLVPTGDTILAWWSSDYYGDPPGTTMRSYRPPELPDGALALERTIPIGTVRLDLRDDARLSSTGLAEEAGGLVTGLSFTIQSGAVECRLTSTYAGIPSEARIRNDASTVGAPVERFALEGVDIDRDDALLARFVPGDLDELAHILLEESTSDVLDIACPDLPTATALLERIHR